MVQRLQSECRMHTVLQELLRDVVQGSVSHLFPSQNDDLVARAHRLIRVKSPFIKYAFASKFNFAACAFFALTISQRRASSLQQKLWSSHA